MLGQRLRRWTNIKSTLDERDLLLRWNHFTLAVSHGAHTMSLQLNVGQQGNRYVPVFISGYNDHRHDTAMCPV